VLPRRLGARFALEALFLVLLALGAGFADLRPLYIVVVMAAAWLLVALAELMAERIERSPLSYLLPPAPDEDERPERVFGPRPEERTVVAPPEAQLPISESGTAEEVSQEAELSPGEAGEAGEAALAEPEPEDAPPLEPAPRGRLRSLLRRREPRLEAASPSPPRHVKLLPRRSAPETTEAAREVAELFGSPAEETEERVKPKETGT
jgi:hypothetical protein